MPWTISYHETAKAEADALPLDLKTRLLRLLDLIRDNGLDRLPPKAAKHLDGELWELRIKGNDGIGRAFYVTRAGQRLVIVHVFVKKTQKTPPRPIKLAQRRAEEV